jgi:membrane-associated phospholipid phosphatase
MPEYAVSVLRSLPSRFANRFLPQGWSDLLRQILLFCGAYWLYRIVRGMTDGRVSEAFNHARHVIGLERDLGLFFEPAVQAWAEGTEWLIDITSWMYVNSHFAITTVTLAFIYLRRNPSFYFIRNMFMVAMGIALVLYAAFPTAPPRYMPEWGFTDSVAHFTGLTGQDSSADALYNPFAAVPSMHVAFALMLGVPMASMARRVWAKTLWLVYPLVVTFVVVATANHWWFDAFTGALTAAAAALTAFLFARWRPAAWAWPAPRPAAAAQQAV